MSAVESGLCNHGCGYDMPSGFHRSCRGVHEEEYSGAEGAF